MKNTVFIIVACLFIVGCAGKIDEKLIGTWKSNRDKTVAECFRVDPSRLDMKPEKKEKFSEIFGHMSHSFTENKITTEYKGVVMTSNYEIIERGSDFIIMKTHFIGISVDGNVLKVRFEKDYKSYWVFEGTEFPENFTKNK